MKGGKRSAPSSQRGDSKFIVESATRKSRRKEQRQSKKKKKHPPKKIVDGNDDEENLIRSSKRVTFSSIVDEKRIPSVKNHVPVGLKKKKKKRKISSNDDDEVGGSDDEADFYGSITSYDHLDDETAAAFRKDDLEINYLESNLGIKKARGSKNKELNREYAKNEGFGEDFGDFLVGLDSLVNRCAGGDSDSDSDGSDASACGSEDEIEVTREFGDPYAHLDEETQLAFRNDDAEIADLEEKLGLGTSSKAKSKLAKDFDRIYGDGFIDFLGDYDNIGERVRQGRSVKPELDGNGRSSSDGSDSSEEEDSEERMENQDIESTEDETVEEARDHDEAFTYLPRGGEDIYGNRINESAESAKPTKYVPPHLRKKLLEVSAQSSTTEGETASTKGQSISVDPETIRQIQRSLNNALNRLSIQTLESVAKSVSSLYSQHSFNDMNACIWKNILTACAPPQMVMSGLIPLYIGAMAGAHWLGGDNIQLGSYLVEWSVVKLFLCLRGGREPGGLSDSDEKMANKEASNLLLITCYLYNYGVCHCSLIYDLVRDLIESFSEIDVESLLLILSHCGQQLRSDDPSALKDIILLVKDRAKSVGNDCIDSSRVQFMVESMIELKNNKQRKQDIVIREKTSQIRKCIGRIKTAASQQISGRKSGSCLRVTLRDLLEAETKGRWWIGGARWSGNEQHEARLWGKEDGNDPGEDISDLSATKSDSKGDSKEDDTLLALALSQRMNTDARRSIFCIIMGSTDCDDAFEKLVRAGLLKPKAERDVIRVIIHCCGEETAYNPFYSHLALRVCEYQHKSRFTLMLTFWDAFKQLHTFSVRKAANLAKLLGDLISSKDKNLTIGVLKRIDFSPGNTPEMVLVFLSVLMDSVFESEVSIENVFAPLRDESVDDPSSRKKKKRRRREVDDSDSENDGDVEIKTTEKEDLSDLRENISLFLMQYVRSGRKDIKGTRYEARLNEAINATQGQHRQI